jgi:hypothetical protein
MLEMTFDRGSIVSCRQDPMRSPIQGFSTFPPMISYWKSSNDPKYSHPDFVKDCLEENIAVRI